MEFPKHEIIVTPGQKLLLRTAVDDPTGMWARRGCCSSQGVAFSRLTATAPNRRCARSASRVDEQIHPCILSGKATRPASVEDMQPPQMLPGNLDAIAPDPTSVPP